MQLRIPSSEKSEKFTEKKRAAQLLRKTYKRKRIRYLAGRRQLDEVADYFLAVLHYYSEHPQAI